MGRPFATPRVRRYIFAHDICGFNGYRVCIRRQGGGLQQYFSSRKYGGRRRALAAAEACVALTLKVLGLPAHGGSRVHTGPVRAMSGVRGVHKNRDGWVAVWFDPPQVRHRVYCGQGSAGMAKAGRVRAQAVRTLHSRAA